MFDASRIESRFSATDARGNVTAETLGNGVKRAHRHDGKTGRVLGILSTRAATGDRQNLTYAWDVLGNLTSRTRGSGPSALTETFGYDTLNRLETYRAGTRAAQTVTYDGYGNVRTKSGVGTYAYGADRNAPMGTTAGPHAVATVKKSDNTEVTYAYDDNGNNVSSSDGRTVAWATFDKPTSIAKGGHTTAFAYAPDRSRFRRIDSNAQGDTTTLYLGGVEKITHPDDSTEIKRYIGGVVIETEGPAIGTCPADATRYVLRDHLGSVDVLTDSLGNEVKSVSFDAWGRPRNPADWTELTDMEAMTIDRCDTRRGFTNHEMLDAVGVIHMNGRIYDPTLARFLQADPFVQFPGNLQGHNRYAYVLNNPLSHTDPSGHFVFTLAATAFFATTSATVGTAATVATLAAAGFGDALLQGASFLQALKSGMLSGVSAAAFSGVGSYLGNNYSGSFAAGLNKAGFALKVALHGTVGGITSVLGGGKFGNGFAAAGFTALGTSVNNSQFVWRPGFSPLRVAIGAAIGGTASRITGGKFANGAVTGAFSQALNNEQSEMSMADQNEDLLEGVTVTEFEDRIIYEQDGASVVVQNDDPKGEIPIVTPRAIRDALYVSKREGVQLRIISGYRADSTSHRLYGAIDVYIEGYTTTETAEALYNSKRFNRVSSYTGSAELGVEPLTTAHADYNPNNNQGLFDNWIHKRN